jgi:hypothetical protein
MACVVGLRADNNRVTLTALDDDIIPIRSSKTVTLNVANDLNLQERKNVYHRQSQRLVICSKATQLVTFDLIDLQIHEKLNSDIECIAVTQIGKYQVYNTNMNSLIIQNHSTKYTLRAGSFYKIDSEKIVYSCGELAQKKPLSYFYLESNERILSYSVPECNPGHMAFFVYTNLYKHVVMLNKFKKYSYTSYDKIDSRTEKQMFYNIRYHFSVEGYKHKAKLLACTQIGDYYICVKSAGVSMYDPRLDVSVCSVSFIDGNPRSADLVRIGKEKLLLVDTTKTVADLKLITVQGKKLYLQTFENPSKFSKLFEMEYYMEDKEKDDIIPMLQLDEFIDVCLRTRV